MRGRPTPPEPGRFGRTLITLEILLAIGGLGGGAYLITHPATAMPAHWLADTPFATWFWPGLALAIVNGVWPAVVAVLAMRRRNLAHIGHVVVGVLLTGWIVVQLTMLGAVSWLQPVYLTYGLLVSVLGFANWRSWRAG